MHTTVEGVSEPILRDDHHKPAPTWPVAAIACARDDTPTATAPTATAAYASSPAGPGHGAPALGMLTAAVLLVTTTLLVAGRGRAAARRGCAAHRGGAARRYCGASAHEPMSVWRWR